MTDTINLHLGDCLDLLPSIPDQSIDLILCDLPYGTTRNKWDSVIPLDRLWAEYRRISSGAIVLFAAQPFTSALVMSNPDWFRYDLVWRKNKASGHLNAKKLPLRAHESVLVFYEELVTYNPQMTGGHRPMNAYYTAHNGSNYGDGKAMAGGGSTDRYPNSVLDWPVLNNDDPERTHPTQKPVGMCEWLIRTYSNEGAVVLDNAMGSGTTGIACLNTGRTFVGMEKDADIFAAATERIRARHERPPAPQRDLFEEAA
jgi:site-specific DNA-methyltransferase (adenine-specific)